MRIHRGVGKLSLVALVALAIAVPLAPPAAAGTVALGDDGEVYRAVTGRYGDLFPQGGAAAKSTPVLAVDVSVPGEAKVRHLVPGSEDSGTDRAPALVFEADSGTAFVIWESRSNPTTSSVLLAGLRDHVWTEPFELSGDIGPLKGSPQVLITRDRYEIPTVADGIVQRSRSVLHAVWWERDADGTESIQYTPVVLESGAYVGWNPVYRLNGLDPHAQDGAASSSATGAAPSEAGLYSSPSLSAGKDLHTVMVAFANKETSRLLTVQARVLPGELGLIADRLRDAVIATGYDPGEDPLRSIRGILRAEIIEIGRRFNPGVVDHFASSVVAAAQGLHDARPHRGIRPFAGDLRAEIIEIGVKALGEVDRQIESKSAKVLEVGEQTDVSGPIGAAGSAGGSVPSVVHLRLIRDLPAPQEPGSDEPASPASPGKPGEDARGPARIFASEDGTRLLVAWDRGSEVVYTESLTGNQGSGTAGKSGGPATAAEAWTAPLALEVGEGGLSADEVERILRSRVQRQP